MNLWMVHGEIPRAYPASKAIFRRVRRSPRDGLELYFTDGLGGVNVGSPRPGGEGGYDIWVSKRATVDDDWGEPENLGPNVNSRSNDDAASISCRRSFPVFWLQRGRVDWEALMSDVARRQHRDDTWETPVNLGPAFNSSSNDWAGGNSADGLTLFASLRSRPGS